MSRSVVGVDVGGTSSRAVRFDDLVAVEGVAAPTPRGGVAIVDEIARLVRAVDGEPSAVAVGMPGRVDHARGVVSSAVNLGIDGPVDVAALLGAALGVAVHLENDVNAAALGAYAHLGLSPAQSLAYVNVGTGIAAGFVLDGRLWRGAMGGAGEIGHVPMRSGSPLCRCGQIGCAEAVGSGSAVTDEPSRRHDVVAATAWAVQLCVMALDVDVVAVGGGMTRPTDTFGAELIEALAAGEATSPMLADLGLARRVVLPAADAPLGSLGAVLAMGDGREVMRAVIIGGGYVVTPGGVLDAGRVTIDEGLITYIGDGSGELDVDAAGGWVVPGFIDLQINGGHGIDVTTEPDRIDELGEALVRYGVTAFVPTVITCPEGVRRAALQAWAGRDRSGSMGAVPLGLHLEGPMLSPARKGAHPADLLVAPSAELIEGWSPEAGVVLATVAPELPGALDVVAELTRRGVVVSIGHTDGSAADVASAIDAGARYVTHLFNAMRPFSHRDPGPIGAALADDGVVVGLICDGLHVDPVAVRLALRALGAARLNLVTDAISALGVDAGRLGGVAVTVGTDGVRNADGVLAGSTLSLDQAVRNLVAFTGCGVVNAVATVTSTPADLLGLPDRGRLVAGKRADVTVLDRELSVAATVVGGEVTWRS